MILSYSNATLSTTTALSTNILGKCQDTGEIDQHFHYRSVIGKLNYSEKSSRTEISYTLYQCTLLYKDPRKPYGGYVKRIGRYLKVTDKMGIYIRPCDSDVKLW